MKHRSGLLVLLVALIWAGVSFLAGGVRAQYQAGRMVVVDAPAAAAESLDRAPSSASLVKVDLQRRLLGTFYVAGEIRGHGLVEMLVDTGSSYSVINQEILQDLLAAGTATFTRNLEGRMADGSARVVPMYRLAELRLGENCVLRDIEAAVFASGTRPILGMALLSRLAPFTFSAEPPRLEFGACDAVALPVPHTTAAIAPSPGAGGGFLKVASPAVLR